MNKAIFLDRDGTINVDYGYVYQPNRLVLKKGVIPGLLKLKELGYLLIIITNQSGIGRNYYSESQFYDFQETLAQFLKSYNITIDEVYYCPHIEADNCNCRKPKLKMFYDAIEKYNIDLSNSYAIGDNLRDVAICEEEPITGILINKEHKDTKYFQCHEFDDAVKYIVNKDKEKGTISI